MNKILLSSSLVRKFDGFIFKNKVAELCGYNQKNGEYIVIDDGMTYSDDEAWFFVKYKFYDIKKGMDFFLSPYKHPNLKEGEGIRIEEGVFKNE